MLRQRPFISARAALVAVFCCALVGGPAVAQHVQIQGDQFVLNGQVYKIKGSNYYPRDHMWAAMWSSFDRPAIDREADLMADLGLNAVRILVPYSNGGWGGANVPYYRLDDLETTVNIMGDRGIRSVVTLFDWETSFPAAGTTREAEHIRHLNAIVDRLKNNPYVRARDPNHPASAGMRWWQNLPDVLSFVDVAIFHSYWPNISTEEIPQTKQYMGSNQKPILVEEWGWPSNPTPCNRDGVMIYDYNESTQLGVYQNHLNAFAQHNIAGGLQWMTFDAKSYTSDSSQSFEQYFGLWKYEYTLKPAGVYYRDHFPVRPFPGTPPAPVSNLAAGVTGASVRLSWQNPSNAQFAGTVIRMSTAGYPTDPTQGTEVCDRAGSPGASDSYTLKRQAAGLYYYTAFSYDTVRSYGPSAMAQARVRVVGDSDIDGDVDQGDYGRFQVCISGAYYPCSQGCQWADFDLDQDVDAADASMFMVCLSGANVPADGTCNTRLTAEGAVEP